MRQTRLVQVRQDAEPCGPIPRQVSLLGPKLLPFSELEKCLRQRDLLQNTASMACIRLGKTVSKLSEPQRGGLSWQSSDANPLKGNPAVVVALVEDAHLIAAQLTD